MDIGPFVDKIVKGVAFLKEFGPEILAVAAGIKAWSIAQGVLNIAQTASPLGLFVASVAALLLLMDQLEKKFGLDKKITEEFGGGVGSEEFEMGRRQRLADRQHEASLNDPKRARLIARNEAAMQSSTVVSGNAALDINISGAPAGSTSSQTGTLTPINLNTGFGGGGL